MKKENLLIKGHKVKLFDGGAIDGVNYPVGDSPRDIEIGVQMGQMFNQVLKERKGEVNELLIVCRGSSGSMLSALVASQLDFDFTIKHLKKTGETSHCGNGICTKTNEFITVIIDDFIDSGSTLNRIKDEMFRQGFLDTDYLVLAQASLNDIKRLMFVPENVVLYRYYKSNN